MYNPYNIELDLGQKIINHKTHTKMVETITTILDYLSSRTDVFPRDVDDMVVMMNGLIEESPYEFSFVKDGTYIISQNYFNGVTIMIPYSGWMSIITRKKIKEYYDVKKSI